MPELLLEHFGAPHHCLTLVLTPERALARASAEKVLEAIAEQGFICKCRPRPTMKCAVSISSIINSTGNKAHYD